MQFLDLLAGPLQIGLMDDDRAVKEVFKELYEPGRELAPPKDQRRKPHPKNRVSLKVEEAVCRMAVDGPAFGKLRVSNELKNRRYLCLPGEREKNVAAR